MKKENKIFVIVKAIITDFILWIYIFGCISFLLYRWVEFRVENKFIIIAAIIFTLFFIFLGDSIGRKIFFPSKKTIHKWFKSYWGWFIATVLIITFIVGWNLVEVDFVKFFTKFKNAGGIMSGIFNPNFDILIMSLTALAETIYLALLATIFAIPFAFILSFFCCTKPDAKNLYW